jgi:hypothetical protein
MHPYRGAMPVRLKTPGVATNPLPLHAEACKDISSGYAFFADPE